MSLDNNWIIKIPSSDVLGKDGTLTENGFCKYNRDSFYVDHQGEVGEYGRLRIYLLDIEHRFAVFPTITTVPVFFVSFGDDFNRFNVGSAASLTLNSRVYSDVENPIEDLMFETVMSTVEKFEVMEDKQMFLPIYSIYKSRNPAAVIVDITLPPEVTGRLTMGVAYPAARITKNNKPAFIS